MPRRAPVGEIQRPYERVKYVTVFQTVSLWDYGFYESLWVHPSEVINIPSWSFPFNISTIIQTTDRKVVLITVYPSGQFVGVDNGWLNSRFFPTCSVTPEEVRN